MWLLSLKIKANNLKLIMSFNSERNDLAQSLNAHLNAFITNVKENMDALCKSYHSCIMCLLIALHSIQTRSSSVYFDLQMALGCLYRSTSNTYFWGRSVWRVGVTLTTLQHMFKSTHIG